MPIQISGVQMGVLSGGPVAINLYDLADVSIVSPTDGQYLRYNGTIDEWQNTSLNADTYAYLDSNMSGSNGISVTYTPGTDQITIALALTASGDASGTVVSSDLPLTLATVNASPQSDTFRKITVNGKGLVTETSAVASTDITGALGYSPVNKAGDTMTGLLLLSGDPVDALGASTKQYVDNVASGIVAKPAVLAATTVNLASTYDNGAAGVGATLTSSSNGVWPGVDGVTTGWGIETGVLVKNQTNAAYNGRYYISDLGSAGTPWVLTRCIYCDTADEIPGSYVFVQDGTQAGTGWLAVVDDPATFVVGTDAINWFQFSGSGTYTAGTGISVSSNVISNTGVVSVAGTAGNITASPSTGSVIVNLATVSNSATGTFQKFTRDTFGRVSGTTAVVASDITSLVDGTYVNVTGDTMTGDLTVTGVVSATSFNATSTIRVKEAVTNIGQSYIDRFANLRPCEYDRKDYVAHEFGFIAEEVALVYPEVVGIDTEGRPSGIDYGKLSTILTAKVQDQQKTIDKLQEQMAVVLELLKGTR